MGEDRTEETPQQVRDSVKDAISKITGKPEMRNKDTVAKPLGEENPPGVKDQPGQASEPR